MRLRIKKHKLPVLVYTTSKDKDLQKLADYNREQMYKEMDTKRSKVKYIMSIFGKTVEITKDEYEKSIKEGLNVKMLSK